LTISGLQNRTVKLRRSLLLLFLILVHSLFASSLSLAEDPKIFKTRYTDISYTDSKALGAFLWRIGGKRFNFDDDPALAKSRIDRIIDRVMDVLDMHPRRFHVKVFVRDKYKEGRVAYYSNKDASITLYADKITDGIFAHEVAHAVICSFFVKTPTETMQEVLAQYVDKHLWSDYD